MGMRRVLKKAAGLGWRNHLISWQVVETLARNPGTSLEVEGNDWRDLSFGLERKLAAPKSARHVARRAAMYHCNWRPCKVTAMAYPHVFDFTLLFSIVFHLRGNDPWNLRRMIHQIVLVGNLHLPKVKDPGSPPIRFRQNPHGGDASACQSAAWKPRSNVAQPKGRWWH